MFPAMPSVLVVKDFSAIRKRDQAYADLLLKEWNDCNGNDTQIKNKAISVYKIGCNKNHPFNYACCDFRLLESLYMNYPSMA